MKSRKDITGQIFGDWTVKTFSHSSKSGVAYWMCLCSCGKMNAVAGSSLVNGRSTKCGRNHRPLNKDKPDMDMIIREYQSGKSLGEISAMVGLGKQKIQYHLKKAGIILRNHIESGRLAGPKIGNIQRGVKRGPRSEATRRKMSASKIRRGNGMSISSSGYAVITMGENEGRRLHDVIMERNIGRRLIPGEVVHHKDRNKLNNLLSNLQLMSNSEHMRLHRSDSSHKKTSIPLSKKKVADVRSLLNLLSNSQIAQELGVTRSSVWKIRTNRAYKCIDPHPEVLQEVSN